MASIIYLTNRINPMWEWFCASYLRQTDNKCPDDIIFVDLLMDYKPEERRKQLSDVVAGRLRYRHVPIKPSIWQGKHRSTPTDNFAASNARNTGFILAKQNYVICVDDLSVPCPTWVESIRHAEKHQYIVMGAYWKLNNLKYNCETGEMTGEYIEDKNHKDSRWYMGSDSGIVPAPLSVLYGCSFGMPMKYVEAVNGFDEACDGQGFEDFCLGFRVGRLPDVRHFYNRKMLTCEWYEAHYFDNVMLRERVQMKDGSGWSPEYMARSVRDSNRIWTLDTSYNLAEVRKRFGPNDEPTSDDPRWPQVPKDAIDWRTGKPLSEYFTEPTNK